MEDRIERIRQTFEARGIPQPPGNLIDARWIATGDWWAKTDQGWFWMRDDGPRMKWMEAPLGPPGENP